MTDITPEETRLADEVADLRQQLSDLRVIADADARAVGRLESNAESRRKMSDWLANRIDTVTAESYDLAKKLADTAAERDELRADRCVLTDVCTTPDDRADDLVKAHTKLAALRAEVAQLKIDRKARGNHPTALCDTVGELREAVDAKPNRAVVADVLEDVSRRAEGMALDCRAARQLLADTPETGEDPTVIDWQQLCDAIALTASWQSRPLSIGRCRQWYCEAMAAGASWWRLSVSGYIRKHGSWL